MADQQNDLQHRILQTVEYLRSRGVDKPAAGIILGTGLGGMVEKITVDCVMEYSEIPNFPVSTLEFHQGRLIYGRAGDTRVLAMQGRFHYYEGFSLQEITYPVRVMKALGISTLLISNASGAMNPLMKKGGLMLLDDHINLIPGSPLTGPNLDDQGLRFPDMRMPYSPRLAEKLKAIARAKDITLYEGIYVAVPGPQFETRAEYRYLRALGADAVGMSTVPEVIVGVHAGMEIAAVSVLTDECDPDNLQPVTLEDLIETAAQAEKGLTEIFIALLKEMSMMVDASTS